MKEEMRICKDCERCTCHRVITGYQREYAICGRCCYSTATPLETAAELQEMAEAWGWDDNSNSLGD